MSNYPIPSILLTITRIPAVAVGLPIVAGMLSGFVTRSSVKTWFVGIRKPPGQPPGYVFPIMWTILYASMGLASHLLVKVYDQSLISNPNSQLHEVSNLALKLYWTQFGLNMIWTPLFFGAQMVLAALIDISILTPTVFALTYYARQVDPRTTYLLGPYCAWLTLATYLNAGVYYLNFWPGSVRLD